MVQLPPTIRLPFENEIPKNIKVLKRWEASTQANIVAGYQLKQTPLNEDSNFQFYAQINVDNPQLWALCMHLVKSFPDQVTFIYGIAENTLCYKDFSSKTILLKNLISYQKELTQDPYIQWGLLHQSNEALTEVFVTPSKYIQFWGDDHSDFQTIMKQYGLQEIPKIEFIDAYPKITLSLQSLDNSALSSEELIEEIKRF